MPVNDRLQLALDTAPIYLWDWDLETGACERTGSATRLLGVASGTADDFYRLVHPEDRPLVDEVTARACAGAPYEIEFRIVTDGRVHWVLEKGRLDHDRITGHPHLVGICMEITDRKRAERSSAFLSEFHRLLMGTRDSVALLRAALVAVARHFDTPRARFCNFLGDLSFAQTQEESSDGAPGTFGRYALSDYLDEADKQALAAGNALVIADVESNMQLGDRLGNFRNAQIRAALVVPFIRDGALRGALAVYGAQARAWRDDEVNLLLDLGARLFAAVERARAEERLRENELRFRLLAHASDDAYWEVDLRSGKVWWNDAYDRRYGPRPIDNGQSVEWWAQRLHPDDRERVVRAFEAAVAGTAERWVEEYRFLKRDGSYATIVDRSLIDRDEQGRPVRAVGSMLDLTERMQAQEQARLQAAKLQRLVDANIIGVIFADTERITEANDAFLAMVGYTRADLEAGLLEWRKMTPPEWAGADDRGFAELQARGACTPFQKQYFRKDGSRVPVVLGAAIIDANAPSWVCFVQDISPIKEAEQELRDADRRKDEFLATLAHELRNPLAPLRTGLQILRAPMASVDTRERTLAMMERQLGQLVGLVDDLLDVGRISQGKIALDLERLDLRAAAEAAVESMQPKIDARAQRLHVSMTPDAVAVRGDMLRLTQVIANLLSNASKFTEPQGDIWLEVAQRGDRAEVSVRDTGVGVPREQLPRLFQMFSQFRPALDRSEGGLGIGLALTKALVGMHHGSIEAHSAGPGRGSEFVVRLPCDSAPASACRRVPAVRVECAPRRILVVDDNHDTADSLQRLLTLQGHGVQVAYDGIAALDAAIATQPEVVLLDIGLPRMNGYDVARHIRMQPWGRAPLLIAITGWGQSEDKARAAKAGFDFHITKPVDVLNLERLLASALPRPAIPAVADGSQDPVAGTQAQAHGPGDPAPGAPAGADGSDDPALGDREGGDLGQEGLRVLHGGAARR